MRTDVANLYVSLFGRAPERDGLGFWVNQLDAGKTVAEIAQSMYNTEPARATYPTFLTNQEVVAKFYTNVLGRTADAEGLAFWTAKLNAGASKGALIAEMITAVNSYAGTDAAALASKALFQNKVAVGLWYAVDQGGNDVNAASSILAGVTSATSSVDAIKAGTVATGTSFALTSSADKVAGTAGNDTISGAFAVNPGTGAATVAVLGALDTIDGGAGTDTLTIEGAQALAGTISNVEVVRYAGDLTALNATTTAAITVDATKVGGLQNLWFDNVTTGRTTGGTLAVSGVAAGQSVGIKGGITSTAGGIATVVNVNNGATVTAATLNVDGAYDTASTGNVLAVNMLGAGLKTVTVAGSTAKTTTITGTVVLDDTSDVVETLNVKADSAKTLTVNADALASLKTVDLSGSAGATALSVAVNATTLTGSAQVDTVTVSANIGSTTKSAVKLGAGNDKLSLTSGTVDFTSVDLVLDGGEGTDTLQLQYADVADLIATTKKATITGFETLGVTGAATTAQTFDASKLGAYTKVEFSGTNTGVVGGTVATVAGSTALAFTKTSATQTYAFTTDVTGGAGKVGGTAAELNGGKAVTFVMENDGATDAVSISLNDTAAAALAATTKVTIAAGTTQATGTVAAASIDATNFETLNILSAGKNDVTSTTAGTIGANANVIGGGANTNSIIVGTNATINVTGTKDVSFVGAIGGTNAKLDASALAGGVSVTMDGTNNVVLGGSSNNTIDGGAGNDTITGGAGKDVLTGGDGKDTLNGGAEDDTLNAAGTSSTTVSDADTLTGGAGKDTFAISAIHTGFAAADVANSIDKIVDFVAGTDTLKLGGTAAANAFYDVFSNDLSAAASVNAAAQAAVTAAVAKFGVAAAANNVYGFTFGGEKYVFMDEATAGTVEAGDAIVIITGVTGTLVKTDFVFAA